MAAQTNEVATYQNYIGGEWVDAASGETSENRDPATGELIGRFPQSGAEDVNRAVAAARNAFDGWRLTPAPRRGEILFRVGQLLAERKEEIARALTREMGKVLVEARGDVQEGIDMAFYMAGEGRRLFGSVVPSELPNKAAYGVRDPLGVVACITPWNFPVAIPSLEDNGRADRREYRRASSPPPIRRSARRLVQVYADAGLPPGVLNFVCGSGSEVGTPLVQHPDVAAYLIHRVERGWARGERRGGAPVQAGNAGAWRQERDHRDGRRRSRSSGGWHHLDAFGTTGQRCTAASRLIVQRGVRAELEQRLLERVTKLRLGPGRMTLPTLAR